PLVLLLVGSPEIIPFDFQYNLNIAEYSVGRLDFAEPEDYAAYARSVVRYETELVPAAKEILFWGPRHECDAPPALSTEFLLRRRHPQARRLSPRPPAAAGRGAILRRGAPEAPPGASRGRRAGLHRTRGSGLALLDTSGRLAGQRRAFPRGDPARLQGLAAR